MCVCVLPLKSEKSFSLESVASILMVVVIEMDTGVEGRGFIFGPPIAMAIGAKFVPMRKPKKLPGMVPFLILSSWD